MESGGAATTMTMPPVGLSSAQPSSGRDRSTRGKRAQRGQGAHRTLQERLRELGAVEGDVASNAPLGHRFEKCLGQAVGIEVSKRDGVRQPSLGKALGAEDLVAHVRARNEQGRDARAENVGAGVIAGPAHRQGRPAEPAQEIIREGSHDEGAPGREFQQVAAISSRRERPEKEDHLSITDVSSRDQPAPRRRTRRHELERVDAAARTHDNVARGEILGPVGRRGYGRLPRHIARIDDGHLDRRDVWEVLFKSRNPLVAVHQDVVKVLVQRGGDLLAFTARLRPTGDIAYAATHEKLRVQPSRAHDGAEDLVAELPPLERKVLNDQHVRPESAHRGIERHLAPPQDGRDRPAIRRGKARGSYVPIDWREPGDAHPWRQGSLGDGPPAIDEVDVEVDAQSSRDLPDADGVTHPDQALGIQKNSGPSRFDHDPAAATGTSASCPPWSRLAPPERRPRPLRERMRETRQSPRLLRPRVREINERVTGFPPGSLEQGSVVVVSTAARRTPHRMRF